MTKTVIDHADGTQTRVTTDDKGNHHIDKSTGGGGQVGSGRSHGDVVKNHTDPGDKATKED